MHAERARGPHLRLFTTGAGCSLCEQTEGDLGQLARRYVFSLERTDIHRAPAEFPDFVFRVPVVHLDGEEIAWGRIAVETIEAALRRVQAPEWGVDTG